MTTNDLTAAELSGPVGYLAHIRAGYPIDELDTGLVMYAAPTQGEVDHARLMAQALNRVDTATPATPEKGA